MIDRFTPIHDPNDPRIEPYRDQKDAWLKAAHNPDAIASDDTEADSVSEGLFISEGSLVLEHHISSRYPLHSVLIAENRVESLGDLLKTIPSDVPIYTAPRLILDAITGYPIHRGLLACGYRLPQPTQTEFEELIEASRALVILEDLSNHDNLGSVFRSVAALAGAGVPVLLSPRCCDPLYRKSLRVSMGHALTIPYAVMNNWPSALTTIKEAGFELLALTPASEASDIDQIVLKSSKTTKFALLFGAEGPGLSEMAMDIAHQRVKIPLVSSADSLNISVSAAVALHRLIPPMEHSPLIEHYPEGHQ
ncbi:MAG: TrmH family RNA methyltransferase [Phycisphaerales bacterium]